VFKSNPEGATAFLEKGHRCTPQRYVVLDYLTRHPVHATADEIHRAVNRLDLQYDVRTGQNHYPSNVYPKDYTRLEAQLRPLRTYAVELRDGEVWVDLE
jgi:hypothetical protein